MSRTSSLFRLQQLDLELDQSRKRVDAVQAILEDDQEIQRLRKTLNERETQLKSARTEHSKAEHEVTLQRTKIERTEKTLYSGIVQDPKELQERQQEAEALRRYLVTLEDRLLEAMIYLDEAQEKHDKASENLDHALEIQETQHKELREELELLSAKITRLEDEHEAALANVQDQDLELYEVLRNRFGGMVIALVHEGSCSACGLGLAHSMQQSIRSSTEPIRCGQCGRILYAG